MKNNIIILILAFCFLPGVFKLSAEAAGGDRVTVPLTDSSRPVHLKVALISGSITVNGYSGKEVIVEAVSGSGEEDEEEKDNSDDVNTKRSGLRKITNTSTGLSVEEDNNEVEVSTSLMGGGGTVDLKIQVPFNCSVKLSTINDGDIRVAGVKGECEVSNTNGSVLLSQISGSAVVDALNGEITVTFSQIDPAKPMSFSSLNGDIDVTFPPDIKATLKMKTEQGDIYSDFDMKLGNSSTKMEDNHSGGGGKYKVTFEKMMSGMINGGGSEILFKNFNGSIYIRKGK